MKKAVLFDLDDTLYEYEPANQKGLREAYSILKKEIKISFDKFIKLYKLSRAEVHRELAGTASSHSRVIYFQRLVEKTHKTVESDVILKLHKAYWAAFMGNMKLRKGVLQTLKQLKKEGLKIAIISDLTTSIQLRKMSELKITPYVDVLVTSEEAGSEKPTPIMFLLTLNKLNLLPQDVIMVGDDPTSDIEGANSVGIDTVLLKTREEIIKFNEDYKKPDYIIKEISEVLKIIKKR